ncbi:unnamed protein product [Ilex paraguariensis]|uniref:Tryptophan synthase beta chain-like PALP domain-containing protein n=1 Tax=Ilex paraguariensis TaxID=185542 RepID=A0ABC8R7Q5_9AQUA
MESPREQPNFDFLTKKPYEPPSWASHLNPVPSHIFSLGHVRNFTYFSVSLSLVVLRLPHSNSQIEPSQFAEEHSSLVEDINVIQRDDLSGMQMSGNKARKLEFLLADAIAQGADCIVTMGGIQSNHCRATAVAAKYLNLDSYLILFTSKALADKDPALTGNLLVERLLGAHVDLVSIEEYAKFGSLVSPLFHNISSIMH